MNKEMFKKMKMPEMMQEDEMLNLEDMPEEGMEAEEMPMEEAGEMKAEASPLADMEDEELLKELEMRGFDVSSLMEKKSPKATEEEMA